MNQEALAQLQAKNPTLPLLPVPAPEFAEYGRLLPQSGAAFLKAAEALKRPAQGSEYLAGVPAFEARLRAAKPCRFWRAKNPIWLLPRPQQPIKRRRMALLQRTKHCRNQFGINFRPPQRP